VNSKYQSVKPERCLPSDISVQPQPARRHHRHKYGGSKTANLRWQPVGGVYYILPSYLIHLVAVHQISPWIIIDFLFITVVFWVFVVV
jgi:hypothetical protein